MAQYIIPTIFTASNQVSRPIAAIQSSFQALGATVTEVQGRMTSLESIMGEDVSNRIKFMVSLAKGMAVIGLATSSARAILDYDKAVQEFRIIVSDLNEMDFTKYKQTAREIALTTNTSAESVVKMFTAIAGLDDRLASTPEKLDKVTRAAVTMQRGGLMEADDAARALVTTLSQFGYGAEQADRVINAFAAGQNRGAFTIKQTSEALVNFGATAKGANMSVENTVGVLQAMAATGIQAAEAGTALNAVILRVQASGRGYKSGMFNFVEGMTELQNMAAKMSPRARDSFIEGVFGKHRYTEGRYLLEHIDDIKRFTEAATGTQEAAKAAAIANGSLSRSLMDLQDNWKTFVSTSSIARVSVSVLSSTVRFLGNNLNILLGIAAPWLGMWAASKVAIYGAALATRAYGATIAAYNYIAGVATVATGRLTGAVLANTSAARGAAFAMKFMSLGLVPQIAIIAAAGLAVYGLATAFSDSTDETLYYDESLGKVVNKFEQIKKPINEAEMALRSYNAAMKSYNEQLEFEAWQKYASSRGALSRMAFDAAAMFEHPFLFWRSQMRMEAKGFRNDSNFLMPNKAEYFPNPSDTLKLDSAISAPPMSANYKKDTAVTVYLNVDKSGNVEATSKSEFGPVPVMIKQTGGPATMNA